MAERSGGEPVTAHTEETRATCAGDTVRLPAEAVRRIKEVVARTFPPRSRVALFGSRTDPRARGGDVDLLVISPGDPGTLTRARLQAIARLQLDLGEQHIDLIATADPEHDRRPIVKEAMRSGVWL